MYSNVQFDVGGGKGGAYMFIVWGGPDRLPHAVQLPHEPSHGRGQHGNLR